MVWTQSNILYLDWNKSSEWLEPWGGLLLATDLLTTYAEAIFRVKWLLTLKMATTQVVETSVANNSPSQEGMLILLRTRITQIISFNQGIIIITTTTTRAITWKKPKLFLLLLFKTNMNLLHMLSNNYLQTCKCVTCNEI